MRKHRVTINVADKNGHTERILTGEYRYIPKRLLRLLFGDFCEVFVFSPGKTIEGFCIHELPNNKDD